MRTLRPLVVAVVVALMTLCALFSLSTHRAEDVAMTPRPAAAQVSAPVDEDAPDEVLGNVDLFGNDVSDAVAEYRFDATGSLYEVHSPQTEIPKLGSPKS